MKPKFKHTCPKCKFVTHCYGCDVYFCMIGAVSNDPKVIVRNGNEPWQFTRTRLSAVVDWITETQGMATPGPPHGA